MIKLYEEEDYNTIARWWIEHDQIPCSPDLLPSIGYIVDDLVAGFLYQTDSQVCYIESLISTKKSTKEERNEALKHLISILIEGAKEMNYKRIIFHTINPKVKEWGQSYGFITFYNSQECFYRDLEVRS